MGSPEQQTDYVNVRKIGSDNGKQEKRISA